MSNRSELTRRHGLTLVPVESVIATSLAGRLALLGVPILEKESVETHRLKKLHQLQKREERSALEARKVVAKWFWISSSVVFLGGVISCFMLCMSAQIPLGIAFGVIGIALGVFCYLRADAIYDKAQEDVRALGPLYVGAQWRRTPLFEFHEGNPCLPQVPIEMRNRARLVKEELPHAKISVDWLDVDPFLVVEHDDEEAFIGVWDEDFIL